MNEESGNGRMDGGSSDGSRPEGPDVDGSHTEGSHTEGPDIGEPRQEGPDVDGLHAEGMVVGGPQSPSTGDARVDAVLTLLRELDHRPVTDHAELYLEVHARLGSELNPAGGPRGAGAHGTA